jgi:integrase
MNPDNSSTPQLLNSQTIEPPPVQTSEPVKLQRHGLTIFKRSANPHAKYACRIKFRGKVHELTLAETAKDSFEMAVRARREIHEDRWDALKTATALRGARQVTLAELEKKYLVSTVEASAATRTQNWNALLQLLDGQSPSQINAGLASAWFEKMASRASAEPDQQRQATLKRSANSRYQQAASVFAPRALAGYKLAGLATADFEKFLAAGELHKFNRIPKKEYNPPAELIIAATLTAWEQLEDRNLFLAIGHELAFGLRAGETVQVKWNWWTDRENYPVLDGAGDFKNGAGHICVRALDPWFSTMASRIAAKSWKGQPDEYVLTGNMTQRNDIVYRAASAWLRAQGWKTQKTNHALRAYAGSQVAMRYSIYDAQTWLRHASVTVTEQHYSHFIKKFRPEDPATLPVKWATKTREFQPIILPAANQS